MLYDIIFVEFLAFLLLGRTCIKTQPPIMKNSLFFFLVLFVAKCACECPKDHEERYKLCVTDKKRMDKECPHFYCGLGRSCDNSKSDPHEDCRAHKSERTSGYCHLAGVHGYMCSEIFDGRVPSKYEGGKCISEDGGDGAACGQNSCPAGMFGSKTPAKKPAHAVWFPQTCQVCAAGSFSSSSSSHACRCPPHGKEAFAPDPKNPHLKTRVRDCKPGTFNDRSYIDPKLDQNDATHWRPNGFGHAGTPCGTCEACPANSFSSGLKGNSHCQCPTLGHQANKDQTDTEQCPKGKFQDSRVSWKRGIACPRCKPCSEDRPGSFADTEGQEKCACPKSGYEANEDGTAERPCRPGTFKNSTDCELCSRCPDGTYQQHPGSHACNTPSTGHYAVNNGTAETSCEPGTFKRGAGPASACTKCKAGFYTPLEGSHECIAAPVGHQPASISARAKAMGHFDGKVACKPGFHQDEEGQASCKKCPRGKFSTGESQSVCDCASSGHIANKERSGEKACPVGTYTADKGGINLECSRNRSSTGNYECTECEAGRFGQHLHQESCSACAEGRFQPSTGKTVCKKCPKHSYQSVMGAEECERCPFWEYQDMPGSNTCISCFTVEAAFGFSHPKQCLVLWIVIGVVVFVVLASLLAKFCAGCSGCCMMLCRGKDRIVIQQQDKYTAEKKNSSKVSNQVSPKKKRKPSLSNVMRLTLTDSDEEEEIIFYEKKN